MARGEQLMRQWKILSALQANRFGLSLRELVEEMGCCKRTVQRDLRLLQEAGFPVTPEQRPEGAGPVGENYWRVENRFIEAKPMILTITEILSLLLSQRLLDPLSGTPLGAALREAIDKMKALLPRKTLSHFDELDEMLIVKETVKPNYAAIGDKITVINEAIAKSRALDVVYQPPGKKAISDRYCPYTLILHQGDLYLLGRLVESNTIRTLKVLRFRSVKLTDVAFTRPEKFRPEAYLNGSFGIIYSGTFDTIRVRFTGWAITEILEHTYHPSQKIVEKKDDCVVVEFELANTVELAGWILHFGRHAVVLEPPALADQIAEELAAARGSYPR